MESHMSDLLEQFLTLVGKSTDHQQLLATAVQERDPVLHARAIEEMGSWEALLAAAVISLQEHAANAAVQAELDRLAAERKQRYKQNRKKRDPEGAARAKSRENAAYNKKQKRPPPSSADAELGAALNPRPLTHLPRSPDVHFYMLTRAFLAPTSRSHPPHACRRLFIGPQNPDVLLYILLCTG